MKRARLQTDHNAEDRIWLAVFLGDDCPEGFNPFIYFDYEWAIRLPNDRGFTGMVLGPAAREAWPRLRDEMMAEWAKRGRKGLPPGAKHLEGKRK